MAKNNEKGKLPELIVADLHEYPDVKIERNKKL